MPRADAESLIPLTPLWFNILLTLASRDLHGYGIIQDIEERTAGRSTPATGTVYLALQRLLEEGLISEARPSSADQKQAGGGRTRRVYGLTSFGREVARIESERLAAQLHVAVDRRIIGRELLGE